MIDYPLHGMYSGSCNLFKYWEIIEISQKHRQIETWLQRKTNGKLYVAYQMAQIPMILNNLEGLIAL